MTEKIKLIFCASTLLLLILIADGVFKINKSVIKQSKKITKLDTTIINISEKTFAEVKEFRGVWNTICTALYTNLLIDMDDRRDQKSKKKKRRR